MTNTRLNHQRIFEQEAQRLSNIEFDFCDHIELSSVHIVHRPVLLTIMEAQFMYTLAKEQIKNLSKFSGSSDEDVITWLRNVEEVFDRTQLQSDNRFVAIQSYLTDAAATWFRYNKANITDWSTFKIELLKVYQPSIDQTMLKLEKRHQLPTESVLEYYYSKLQLCLQADSNMSDPTIIHYLSIGLNKSLIDHVIRRHPATPSQFLIIAQDEEKIRSTLDGLHIGKPKTSNYPIDDDPIDESVMLLKHSINTDKRSTNFQQRKSFSEPHNYSKFVANRSSPSFRNKHYQHSSSSFSSRQCYACYQFGHIAKQCPNQKNQVPVNDITIKVLVDSGAAISLIHQDKLKHMSHININKCALNEVHTANSGFIHLTGIVTLNVRIDKINTTVNAYVTRDLICDMILGRDWIQQNQVNICFFTHRIYILNKMASAPLLPLPDNEKLIMTLPYSIVIPPYHEKLISGYVPITSANEVLFTPNTALQHAKLVFIPHSIVNIHNNHGILSIKNPTRHPKMISCNTPLGFISQLEDGNHINLVLHPNLANVSSFHTNSVLCDDHNTVCSNQNKLDTLGRRCNNIRNNYTTHNIVDFLQHLDDPSQRMKAHQMLNRYIRLFDDSCSTGINCLPQHAINTASHPPIAVHPRKISSTNQQIIRNEINKMVLADIISPSNSPWSSPVVIVKKKDGSPRFCIDYRRLNAVTQKDVYPLPRMDDVIEHLSGSKMFSKLDLKTGYFQVPLAHEEQEKTAFITTDGLWQFNRLPQGLKNSPSVFQRLMNQTLGKLRWDICLAYLDDIIVYSSCFDQHLTDLDRVLHTLHSSNFKLNRDKCALFQTELSFLGHHISGDGCLPTNDNIRAITEFSIPKSSKAAHSFLQMAGFYRKFVPRFAAISSPLNKFTRKGIPFIWTDIEQTAFDQLKAALTSSPVLILPDPSSQYTIRTDASRLGIGAVLLQKVLNQHSDATSELMYKPVAFISRTLKPAEKNYSAIELEALSIWWSVTQKFRPYIEGQQFVLETDHKPLLSLMKKPYQNGRIERWMEALQQYDMTVQYIRGKDNTTADALSRYPVDKPDTEETDELPHVISSSTQTDNILVGVVTTRSMVRRQQGSDTSNKSSTSKMNPLLYQTKNTIVSSSSSPQSRVSIQDVQVFFDDDILKKHQNNDPYVWKIKNSQPLNSRYIIDTNDILCKIITRKSGHSVQLRYIPCTLISKILLAYHNSTFNGGHFGIKRTYYKIRDRFYWPHMYKDIEKHVLSCINCKKNNYSRRKLDGHLQPIEPPRGIWERLAMDYVGPVPRSRSGHQYFIVLTDLFSKYVVTKAVSDNTATTAAKFLLYDVFMVYGVPQEIITDNGRHFTASLYESLLKLTGCCHIKTTPYHPQSNGQCERHNATLVPNLVALSNHARSNWDEKLSPTTFNYNATRHATTGYAPFELMFARQPRLLADPSSPLANHPDITQYSTMMHQFIEHIKIAARTNNVKNQSIAKQRYDQHRSDPRYLVGRKVLIRNRDPSMNKFSPKFIGPYVICRQVNYKTYIVKHDRTGTQAAVTVQDIRPID